MRVMSRVSGVPRGFTRSLGTRQLSTLAAAGFPPVAGVEGPKLFLCRPAWPQNLSVL